MPQITIEAVGANTALAEIMKFARGMTTLGENIKKANGDFQKVSQAVQTFTADQGKALGAVQKLVNAELKQQQTINQLISSVSKYATEEERAAKASERAVYVQGKLREALARNHTAFTNLDRTSKTYTADVQRLNQECLKLVDGLANAGRGVQATARNMEQATSAAKRWEMELDLIWKAQQEINTIIDRGVPAYKKLENEIERTRAAYRGGGMDLQQLIAALRVLETEHQREIRSFNAESAEAKRAALEVQLFGEAHNKVAAVIQRFLTPLDQARQELNQLIITFNSARKAGHDIEGIQTAIQKMAQEVQRLSAEEKKAAIALREQSAEAKQAAAAAQQLSEAQNKVNSVLAQFETPLDRARNKYGELIQLFFTSQEAGQQVKKIDDALEKLAQEIIRLEKEEKKLDSVEQQNVRTRQKAIGILEQSLGPGYQYIRMIQEMNQAKMYDTEKISLYNQAIGVLKGNYKDATSEAKGATTETGNFLTTLGTVKSTVGNVAAAFGMGVGVAGMIDFARQNLQRFEQQLRDMGVINADIGQEWRLFASEVASQDPTGKELGRFKSIIEGNIDKGKYDAFLGVRLGRTAIKTAGMLNIDMTPEQSLGTADYIANIYRKNSMQQTADSVLKGMMDLSRQFKPGMMTDDSLYSLLQLVTSESRVDSIDKAAQTFPRLLSYYKSTGLDDVTATSTALADFAMLTQKGVDPMGHITTYSLIMQAAKKENFLKQLKTGEIQSEWEEDQFGNFAPIKGAETLKIGKIDVEKLKNIKTIEEFNDFLIDNPEFEKVFERISVKGGRSSTGMVRLQGAVRQMKTPESRAERERRINNTRNLLTNRRADGRLLIENIGEAERNFMKNSVPEYEQTQQKTTIETRKIQEAPLSKEESMYEDYYKRVREIESRINWETGWFSPSSFMSAVKSGAWGAGIEKGVNDKDFEQLIDYIDSSIGYLLGGDTKNIATIYSMLQTRKDIIDEKQLSSSNRPNINTERMLEKFILSLVRDNEFSDSDKDLVKKIAKVNPDFIRIMREDYANHDDKFLRRSLKYSIGSSLTDETYDTFKDYLDLLNLEQQQPAPNPALAPPQPLQAPQQAQPNAPDLAAVLQKLDIRLNDIEKSMLAMAPVLAQMQRDNVEMARLNGFNRGRRLLDEPKNPHLSLS